MATVAAAALFPQTSPFFIQRHSGPAADSQRIEMDISGNLLEIMIRIHQELFITPLIEMACSIVGSAVVGGLGDIEMVQQFPEVSQRTFDKSMKAIEHQHIDWKFCLQMCADRSRRSRGKDRSESLVKTSWRASPRHVA